MILTVALNAITSASKSGGFVKLNLNPSYWKLLQGSETGIIPNIFMVYPGKLRWKNKFIHIQSLMSKTSVKDYRYKMGKYFCVIIYCFRTENFLRKVKLI